MVLPVTLLLAACRPPVQAGVLTLAPAAMRLSGPCTPQSDGTLTMAASCTAEAEPYVGGPTATITVRANGALPDRPVRIAVWFAGEHIGDVDVTQVAGVTVALRGYARDAGPVPIRLVSAGRDGATVTVEKLVITEP